MSRQVISTLEHLRALIGQEVGSSDWLVVDQARIDAFAEATNDRQWIHVDPVRAAAGSFGSTIAHGFLTVSLLPYLGAQIYGLEFGSARLNYGMDTVRFPSPVVVDSRVRASATFTGLRTLPKGVQLTTKFVVEIEQHERPACVASLITLIVA